MITEEYCIEQGYKKGFTSRLSYLLFEDGGLSVLFYPQCGDLEPSLGIKMIRTDGFDVVEKILYSNPNLNQLAHLLAGLTGC